MYVCTNQSTMMLSYNRYDPVGCIQPQLMRQTQCHLNPPVSGKRLRMVCWVYNVIRGLTLLTKHIKTICWVGYGCDPNHRGGGHWSTACQVVLQCGHSCHDMNSPNEAAEGVQHGHHLPAGLSFLGLYPCKTIHFGWIILPMPT